MCLSLELVLGISEQQLGFADLRLADKDELEHVVIACILLLAEEVILLSHVFFTFLFSRFDQFDLKLSAIFV